jgi:WD40 repeat protein
MTSTFSDLLSLLFSSLQAREANLLRRKSSFFETSCFIMTGMRHSSTSSSGSSGDGDEFFDAAEQLADDEDDPNCKNADSTSTIAEEERPSLDEAKSNSGGGEEKILSPNDALPSKEGGRQYITHELQENETWRSARCIALNSSEETSNKEESNILSRSLVDVMSESASFSYDESTDKRQVKLEHDKIISGDGEEANNFDDVINKANVIPIIATVSTDTTMSPKNRIDSSPSSDQNIYNVSTESMEEVVQREYDDEQIHTLENLVDKLETVDRARQLGNEEYFFHEKVGASAEVRKINDFDVAERKTEISQKNSPEKFLTPNRTIDCGRVTDIVCNIKSPLETFYLMCPVDLKGVEEQEQKRTPMRTSFTNEDGDIGGAVSPPHRMNAYNGQKLHWDSDSSDSDNDSISKFQMIDKDTGRVHDIRDVMKEMDEAGICDAMDTRYTLLPTKNQLQFQRQSSIHQIDSKDSEESGIQAVSSIDTLAEVEGKSSERNKGSLKIPPMPSSKLAASVRKGVTGLATSRHAKANKRRNSPADILPSNAVYVKSQKQIKSTTSTTAEQSQGAKAGSSFNPMLLIKTLPNVHKGPAWCASFSRDGRFLATGGEDGNVCIWAISPKSKVMHPEGIMTQHEGSSLDISRSKSYEADDCSAKSSQASQLHFIGNGPELATNLEILASDPIQRFKDHTADVIDLSWSRTNFLLSASLDCSVRLYHHSKLGCLHLFKHANLVASVAFHPSDDRFFISGGVDKKLRLWDITDGLVKEWSQAPDVITAVRYTPDGKYAVAGLFQGQVYFYEADRLKYYTQIACRNRSGKHKRGKKVTGISFVREERDDWLQVQQKFVPESEEISENATLSERFSDRSRGMVKLVSSAFRKISSRAEALRYTERMLVSTNDSRVRLYGLNDFCLVRKYKGHSNYSMQIRARISDSGSHIACGSESGHVFIWETLDKKKPKKSTASISATSTHDKTKHTDYFEASKATLPIVTDTVFFRPKSVIEALLSSDQVFPFALGLDRVDDDMSSAAILTLDYDGTMRVFLRKSCIDNILDASTPRGNTMT